MLPRALLLLIIAKIGNADIDDVNGPFNGLRILLRDCPVKLLNDDEPRLTPFYGFIDSMTDCVRNRAFRAIDRILEDDVVPIVEGVELVRFVAESENRSNDRPNVVDYIRKSIEHTDRPSSETDTRNGCWYEKLSDRLARALNTHVIKIDVERLRNEIYDDLTINARQLESRGRRRRKRHMSMMPIVMMGMLLMGSVLVPMAFQFLAVLGGKALILAKMALMMSSIQGLKKIATSGINYGLYHTGVPEPWHERSAYLDLASSSTIEVPPPPSSSSSSFNYHHHQQQSPQQHAILQQHDAIGPAGPYYGHFVRRSSGPA